MLNIEVANAQRAKEFAERYKKSASDESSDALFLYNSSKYKNNKFRFAALLLRSVWRT